MYLHPRPHCAFPETVGKLLQQAKFFTGLQIRLRPSREYSEDIQPKENNNFLFFEDTEPGWNRRLYTSRIEHFSILRELLEYVGDQMRTLNVKSEKNFGLFPNRFFAQQSAQLAADILCGTLNLNRHQINRNISYCVKKETVLEDPSSLSKTNVWLAEASPMGQFYMGLDGVRVARSAYFEKTGLVRFDLIASKVAQAAPHLKDHYDMLTLFGRAAGKLARNQAFREEALRHLPHTPPDTIGKIRDLDTNSSVNAILRCWWDNIDIERNKARLTTQENFYIGDPIRFESEIEATEHPHKIHRIISFEAKKRPQNPLTTFIGTVMREQKETPTETPSIEPRLKRWYAQYPDALYTLRWV